jgi:hypothetical protein
MPTRPRLAVVTTAYYPLSHSDVIVSRWLEPRATDREFGWPVNGDRTRTDIVSLYIAQFPENDTGRETAARHHVPLFSTIREALTLGGDSLAVDGVLLIGEHGDYPHNEWSQKMYPRRELFDEIVAVFRAEGRSVPVFCDKHLSYDAASAQHMAATAGELDFPLMAGSSIPIGGFMQPWTMPDGAALREGIGLYYGSLEAYGYHSIEFLQSLVAKRAGGESGIESVTAYYGDSFREAETAGAWSPALLQAALKQAHNCQSGEYPDNLKGPRPPQPFGDQWPAAYCFQHRDGLRTSHLMLNGHIADFAAAVQEEDGALHAGCSRSSVNAANNFYAHFAMLDARIEEFMLTGQAPFPLEHYLLSTLAIAAAVRALAQPGETLATPDLALSYRL